MPIDAFLFDFNGVIIDDEPIHRDAFREVLAPHGIDFTEEEYWTDLLGIPDTVCLDVILSLRRRTIDDQTRQQILLAKAAAFDRLVRERDVDIPGLPGFVLDLAEHVPVGIVSGGLRVEIEYQLRRLGIDDCFRMIVSAGEYAVAKPDPAPYRIGIARLEQTLCRKLDPAKIVAVEDSPKGLASGLAAGMPVLGFSGRIAAERLRGCFAVVPDFTGLTFAQVQALLDAAR